MYIDQELRFSGGINMDTNPESLPATSYRNARNIDILGDDSEDYSSITNSHGNKKIIELPNTTGEGDIPLGIGIVGYKHIMDKVIIFTTAWNKEAISTRNDQIWVADYDSEAEIGSLDMSGLKYNGELNLSKRDIFSSIEIDYRSSDKIFVYWSDGRNELRGCNVMDTDLSTYTPDSFGSLPNAKLSGASVNIINNTGGSFNTGVVQYTYKLIKGSSITNFAPIENSYIIYKDAFPATYTSYITGSTSTEVTTKSCQVSVNVQDITFDEIEIYRVFYQYKDIDPVVNKIYSGPVTGATMTYTDNGVINLDSLSYLELSEVVTPFIPDWLASADNRLFAANIKEHENSIDYDARAYRFKDFSGGILPSAVESKYYTYASDTTPSLMYDGGVFTAPEDADIGPYLIDDYKYKYKPDLLNSDPNVLGGTGPNIDYEFVINESDNDTNPTSPRSCTNYNRVNAADKSPYTVLNISGFMREEIYRFGVTFINSKGIPNFVNWISDIKMPSQLEFPITDSTGGKQRILGVKFNLSNIPIDPLTGDYFSYRIVYVERSEFDKSIIDQGYVLSKGSTTIGSSYPYEPYDYYSHTGAYPPISIDELFFYSPATSYFRSSDRSSYVASKLKAIARVEVSDRINQTALYSPSEPGGGGWDDGYGGASRCGWSTFSFAKYYDRTYPSVSVNETITESTYLKAGNDLSGFSTKYDFNTNDRKQPRLYGTSNTIVIENGFSDIAGNIFNIVKEDLVQYGGSTNTARTTNVYIPASDVTYTSVDNSSVECFNGDTFITHWQLLASMSNADGTVDATTGDTDNIYNSAGYINMKVIPLECSFKTELETSQRILDIDYISGGYAFEDAGVYTFKSGDWDDRVTTWTTDQYIYNSVNAKINNTIKYIPKPYSYETKVTDNLIKYSEKNTPYNTDSSWKTWKTNNYQSVEKNSGSLTSIHNWINNILFMQSNGFGVCNVNERVTKSDGIGIATVLGTGDVLGKPSYISSKNGSIHGESVLVTNNSVTFYDRNNQGLILYQKAYTGNSSKEISKIKGINSLLKKDLSTLINNRSSLMNYADPEGGLPPMINNNLHIGVNAIENRGQMFYTFYDAIPENNGIQYSNKQSVKTIKFNEITQTYVSFYDFNSPIYDSINGKITMLHPLLKTSIWINSDIGTNRCNYFGAFYDSEITISSNGSNPASKVYTNWQYTSDVTNSDGTDDRLNTFSTMEMSNSYQSTGIVDIALKKNAKRRFRKWNITTPRALKSLLNPRRDVRMRDKYLECKFVFPNTDNKKFELRDMKVTYKINQDEFRKLNKDGNK